MKKIITVILIQAFLIFAFVSCRTTEEDCTDAGKSGAETGVGMDSSESMDISREDVIEYLIFVDKWIVEPESVGELPKLSYGGEEYTWNQVVSRSDELLNDGLGADVLYSYLCSVYDCAFEWHIREEMNRAKERYFSEPAG